LCEAINGGTLVNTPTPTHHSKLLALKAYGKGQWETRGKQKGEKRRGKKAKRVSQKEKGLGKDHIPVYCQ
jgi:hypothetical protein